MLEGCTHEFKTMRTRQTPVSTLRRKECKHCGARITTHEVSADFFEQAKQNQIVVNKLRELLPSELLCKTCIHNVDGACGFDLPEYNTIDANDCNLFDGN